MIAEENLSQKLFLVSIVKNKDPSIRVKMHQTFFFILNKIMKIEHQKISRGPLKILKNIS